MLHVGSKTPGNRSIGHRGTMSRWMGRWGRGAKREESPDRANRSPKISRECVGSPRAPAAPPPAASLPGLDCRATASRCSSSACNTTLAGEQATSRAL
eukprot:1444039-Prymnesium_polylepis.2